MTIDSPDDRSWAARAVERSDVVQRSRERVYAQSSQIISAALDLVDEKGSAFTIQELATHAHVAMQTFYRHFSSKDELLLAVIDQMIHESMKVFDDTVGELPDPISRLKFLITAPILYMEDHSLDARRRFITAEHYRLHQVFPDAVSEANSAYTERLVPQIDAAVELGQLAPIDAESAAWHITQLVNATYHHHAFATAAGPAQGIAEDLWMFCGRALRGDSALARPNDD